MSRIAATVFLISLCLTGCTSRLVSNTPRTAIEQLLLSGAVDKVMERIDLPQLSGKTVYLDFSNLQAYDVHYIRAAARARFAEMGCRLVDAAEGADFVAEISSGGLGTEYKKSLIGLPSLPVPNSPTPTPELALYRSVEQTGIVKLLIFVHSDGKFVAANYYYAKYDRSEGFLLFWRYQGKDEIREGWERADLDLDAKLKE
ncbi:MAG: hypothetical protein GWP05_03775 [Anaerolineaceae bacterium]|nr:hypothetical protein [Anaerolineaceae bacterium]